MNEEMNTSASNSLGGLPTLFCVCTSRRYPLVYFWAVLLLILAGACSEEISGSDPVLAGGSASHPGEVSLSLCIPGVTPEAVDTRALDAIDECRLQREMTHLLLFRHNGSADDDTDAAYIYHRRITPDADRWGEGSLNAARNYVQPFRIDMSGETITDRFRAMIVGGITEANMGTADVRLTGASLSDVHNLLHFMQEDLVIWNTDKPGFTPLPFWGKSRTSFTPQDVAAGDIALLRGVARIDVGVNLTGSLGGGSYDLDRVDGRDTDRDGNPFQLVSVTLHNAARSGSIAPAPGNYRAGTATTHVVTAATTDATTAYHSAPLSYTYESGTPEAGGATNMIRRRIYLPEVTNRGVDRNENAFYIVVAGRYSTDGSPVTTTTPVTFYRLDFYDRNAADGTLVKPSAANRFDVLRNHAYIVNILRVRGPGYATAALAAASEPVNMEVDIRSWDTGTDMSNITTDGQYRLALSASGLQYHTDGTAQDLSVFTNYLLDTDPDASGWRLTVGGAAMAAVIFYDADGNQVDPADWGTNGISSGPANLNTTLRVGMRPYSSDPANGINPDIDYDGLLERTATLSFTAGRMTMEVNLVQDVRSTVTLTLTPAALTFTREPRSAQFVTARYSPPGATLYAVWTEGEGDAAVEHKYNISDPAANTGVTPPTGFTDDTDDIDRHFFHSANAWSATATIAAFTLLPTQWDEEANGGTAPSVPRRWPFTLRAEWSGGRHAVARFEVEQSHVQLFWELFTREGGSPIPMNTISVSGAGGDHSAYARTNDGLRWYLPSYTETSNHSGQQWLTNWETLTAATFTGSVPLTFSVAPNPHITSRSMTIQASASQEGFPHDDSRIILEQEGGPLILELGRGLNTAPADFTYRDADATYVLDYGLSVNPGFKGVNVRANTDWRWIQCTDALGADPDPDDGTFLRAGPGHYTNWLVANLNNKFAPGSGSGDGTSGNSDDRSILRSWEDAFGPTTPEGLFLPLGSADDAQLVSRKLPLAGRYYTELRLHNRHDRLDPANPADAGRIDAAAKRLRIRRTIPALWRSLLPFGGQDRINLNEYTNPDANHWSEQRLALNSNTPVRLTLTRNGTTMHERTFTPADSYASFEVDRVLTHVVRDEEVGWDKPMTTYVLILAGHRQTEAGQADRTDYSMRRTYFSGYRMNMPAINGCRRGATLSGRDGHSVTLDFGTSAYHDAQQVRIVRQAYDTDGRIINGDITYTGYTLNSLLGQRYIRHDLTENPRGDRMYSHYVEFQRFGSSEWTGTFDDGQSNGPGNFLFLQDARADNAARIYGNEHRALPTLWSGMQMFDRKFQDDPKGDIFKFLVAIDPWYFDPRSIIQRPYHCELTGRELYCVQPGTPFWGDNPKTDGRGVQMLEEYYRIYGRAGRILGNVHFDIRGECTSAIKFHDRYYGQRLWSDGGGVHNRLAGSEKCGRFHGFFGEGHFNRRWAEAWYLPQVEDEKLKSIDLKVITVGHGFSERSAGAWHDGLMGTRN